MDSFFNPPRHRFNTTMFDNNLEAQHEELKRFAQSAVPHNINHHTEPIELEAIIEKIETTE